MGTLSARLTSRKLWLTVLSSFLVAFGDQFGIALDQEQIMALAAMVVAYVTGESVIDRQRAKAEVDAGVERLKADANKLIAALIKKLQELESASAEAE